MVLGGLAAYARWSSSLSDPPNPFADEVADWVVALEPGSAEKYEASTPIAYEFDTPEKRKRAIHAMQAVFTVVEAVDRGDWWAAQVLPRAELEYDARDMFRWLEEREVYGAAEELQRDHEIASLGIAMGYYDPARAALRRILALHPDEALALSGMEEIAFLTSPHCGGSGFLITLGPARSPALFRGLADASAELGLRNAKDGQWIRARQHWERAQAIYTMLNSGHENEDVRKWLKMLPKPSKDDKWLLEPVLGLAEYPPDIAEQERRNSE